jgi:SAM-dependent methyltransferase
MPTPPRFAPVVSGLRDEVIEFYERRGQPLDTDAGRRTLATNSTLAADRGRLLLRLLADCGAGPVAGSRLLDLGAGFGALSLYFAHLGADVTAVDPNRERLGVTAKLARAHQLQVETVSASAASLPLADGAFEFVVANNSLCYLVDPELRRLALAEVRRVLAPGGWLVMRDPNRLTPRDPFTSLPLLTLLPPRLIRPVVRALGRERSDVRLRSPAGAILELRRAGFLAVRWRPPPGHGTGSLLGPYLHLVARRSANLTGDLA